MPACTLPKPTHSIAPFHQIRVDTFALYHLLLLEMIQDFCRVIGCLNPLVFAVYVCTVYICIHTCTCVCVCVSVCVWLCVCVQVYECYTSLGDWKGCWGLAPQVIDAVPTPILWPDLPALWHQQDTVSPPLVATSPSLYLPLSSLSPLFRALSAFESGDLGTVRDSLEGNFERGRDPEVFPLWDPTQLVNTSEILLLRGTSMQLDVSEDDDNSSVTSDDQATKYII